MPKTTARLARSALSLAVAGALCAPAAPTLAADARPLALEEVVVTAQKREQNVQDVPVSVTAISADMIRQAAINNTQDIVKVAPSLTFTGNVDKQGQAFSVRGIGTNTFGINIEQSVAFIVDDVATVQPGQSIANLADIERIEILRGPQSTLFGKSASAGAIVITTQDPAQEFEGSVTAGATSDDEYRVKGTVSGPVSDTLGYRLSGYWNDWDGNIDNLYNGDQLNDTRNWGARGKLQWDITDALEMMLTVSHDRDDSSCCAMTLREFDPTAQLFGVLPVYPFEGLVAGDDNHHVRYDTPLDTTTKNSAANVRFNADLGDFTLLSISAYNEWKYRRLTDVDGTDIDLAAIAIGGDYHGGMYESPQTKSEFFSQEFRLLSPTYDRYDYLVGLYYADATTTYKGDRNLDPPFPFIQVDDDAKAGTETAAVYGQLTWHFTDATSFTGGLRYHYERISADYTDHLLDNLTISSHDSDSKVVGKAALQHFLVDDVMVYLSYATGYKGQAYDITSGFDEQKAQNPVKPETSESWELGVKSEFWAHRLQVNATAFHSKYDDFQAQSTEIDESGALTVNVLNVGKLETNGVELESTALLTADLTLTVNAAYMDAKVNDYTGAACWPGQTEAQGCIGGDYQNVDNGTLPAAPKWKYSVFLDYQLPLDSLPFDGFANASYVWVDDQTFDINQDPNMYQDAYGIANLQLGIVDDSQRYRVTLFANNLLDEHYTSGMRNPSPLYGNQDVFAQVLPRDYKRYFGISADYNF